MPRDVDELKRESKREQIEQFLRDNDGVAYTRAEICDEIGFDDDERVPAVVSLPRLRYGEIRKVTNKNIDGERWYWAEVDDATVIFISFLAVSILVFCGMIGYELLVGW
jgi:hypothetical protein